MLTVRMRQQTKHIYEFGPFRLDATERLLLRDGEYIPLPPKVFETLLALVESHGHLLAKEELIERIWPDTFVEEINLTKNISALRKMLSHGDGAQEYIETIPKRGYRFVAEVREVRDNSTALLMAERTKATIIIEEEEDGSRVEAAAPALISSESHALTDSDKRKDKARWRQPAAFVSLCLILIGAALALYY